MNGPAALTVRGLRMRFGGVEALAGVDLDVPAGRVCGLIGPNGSGKTTLFNCISGFCRPQAGDIRLDGRSLCGLPRHRIAGLGIGRTFQNGALFRSMTVAENILTGAHALGRSGFLAQALRGPGVRAEARAAAGRLEEMLAQFGLAAERDRPVGTLPLGSRKRVELARALIARPRVLLLDEPAAGLNPAEVADLAQLIRDLPARSGLTVLLVEHHMGLVMRVSDCVVALDFGRVIAAGTPAAVRADPAVIRAYLGAAEAA